MSFLKNLFKKQPEMVIKFPINLDRWVLNNNSWSETEKEMINQFSKNDIRDIISVLSYTEGFINGYYQKLKYSNKFEGLDTNNEGLIIRSSCEFSIFLFVLLILYTKFGDKKSDIKDFIWLVINKTFVNRLSHEYTFENQMDESFQFWWDLVLDLKKYKRDTFETNMSKVYIQLIKFPMTSVSIKSNELKDYRFQKTLFNNFYLTSWITELEKIYIESINKDLN